MRLLGSVLATLLAAPAVQAGVLVVDHGGGGDFTNLTAAVAAASNGDTILVRAGVYTEPAPVVIDGKGLTILGEDWTSEFLQYIQPQVLVSPGLVVRNLAPGENCFLINVEFWGAQGSASAPASPGLLVLDNVAHVRLQACWFLGGGGGDNQHPDGAPAIRIANSTSMALIGGYVEGGSGQFSDEGSILSGNGGAGVELAGGQLLVQSAVVTGGSGGSYDLGASPEGGDGGPGILHTSGSLLIVSCGVTGGDGGLSVHGGDGGDGLVMGASGFAWQLGGASASGGHGGFSTIGPAGADGVGLVDPSSLVTNFGGSPHGFGIKSPVREGQMGKLLLGGAPTDSTWLFASLSLHQLPLPGYEGVLMLAPTALIGPFVFAPPGTAELPFVVPTLPAGIDSLQVHVQPAYVGLGGTALGPGQVLVILDSAF